MIAGFVFSELSPNAAGTAASSRSVTASTVAGVAAPLDDWEAVEVVAEFGGATGDTLDVYLQISADAGNTWYDAVHWAQAAAASGVKIYRSPLSLATTTNAPVVVGKNLSPALAANTVVNGAWSDRARLLMVSGPSTSAGTTVNVKLAPQRVRTNQM